MRVRSFYKRHWLTREANLCWSQDDYWVRIRALHLRSGRGVFDEAVGLCSSSDPILRAVGADILAQLGVREAVADYPFADESAATLVSLLGDADPHVTMSALRALAARGESHHSRK